MFCLILEEADKLIPNRLFSPSATDSMSAPVPFKSFAPTQRPGINMRTQAPVRAANQMPIQAAASNFGVRQSMGFQGQVITFFFSHHFEKVMMFIETKLTSFSLYPIWWDDVNLVSRSSFQSIRLNYLHAPSAM